jgi:hypothetical protein
MTIMAAQVTKCNGTMITLETTVDIGGSMLKAEEAIQAAVNDIGVVATGEALKRFDADGDVIVVGGTKWYAKAPEEKYFQTPYGEVIVPRYVYECARGGKTFCPLEQGKRQFYRLEKKGIKCRLYLISIFLRSGI